MTPTLYPNRRRDYTSHKHPEPLGASLCADADELKPTMRGDIYAGGRFNIAAVAAANENSGLIPSPTDHNARDAVIPVVSPAWAAASGQLFIVWHRTIVFSDCVSRSPVWSAPSFHQETLLSMATLYCNNDQAWWHCPGAGSAAALSRGWIPGAESADGAERVYGQSIRWL